MRLSRHAKNEMRLYRIGADDVEATVASPSSREWMNVATLASQARRATAVLSL